MSQWTHVAALFRLDTTMREMTQEKLEEIIGAPITYDDMCRGDWFYEGTKYLPHGREGSLAYACIENEDDEVYADAYIVTVTGDLRDYDNSDEIEKWFMDSLKGFDENSMVIRQACITIEVEYQNTTFGTIVQKGFDYILQKHVLKYNREEETYADT